MLQRYAPKGRTTACELYILACFALRWQEMRSFDEPITVRKVHGNADNTKKPHMWKHRGKVKGESNGKLQEVADCKIIVIFNDIFNDNNTTIMIMSIVIIRSSSRTWGTHYINDFATSWCWGVTLHNPYQLDAFLFILMNVFVIMIIIIIIIICFLLLLRFPAATRHRVSKKRWGIKVIYSTLCGVTLPSAPE